MGRDGRILVLCRTCAGYSAILLGCIVLKRCARNKAQEETRSYNLFKEDQCRRVAGIKQEELPIEWNTVKVTIWSTQVQNNFMKKESRGKES